MWLPKKTQTQTRISQDKHPTQPQLKLDQQREPLEIVDVLDFLWGQPKSDNSKFPLDEAQIKQGR